MTLSTSVQKGRRDGCFGWCVDGGVSGCVRVVVVVVGGGGGCKPFAFDSATNTETDLCVM